MSGRYILSIDQGTTSTRAILFDQEARSVASAQKELTQYYPKPGFVEHEASEIWRQVQACIAELMSNHGLKSEEIAAIGITNQRETVLLWDKETGLPLARAICWQSRQTAPFCEALKKAGHAEMIKAKTGLVIDPYFSASKIRFLLDQIPMARARAHKGEILAGTIDSWLLYKLSGGQLHATDVSNASRTQLMNIHSLDWDEELLALFDIPRSILPSIRPSSAMYGTTQTDPFLGHAIPLASMIGDQQSALFAHGCFEKGMVKNTYGTGCFVLMQTGEEAVQSKHGLITSVAWQLDGQHCYCLEGSVFVAGSVIQWLRDELGLLLDASESAELASRVNDSQGVVLVPAFTGLGAPHWDEGARGAIFGLTRGTHRNHLVRAALEAIALQNFDILEAMEDDSHMPIQLLRVDGGASQNTLLMQMQADLLKTPLEQSAEIETTALGAAILAGLAVGFWKDKETALQGRQPPRRFDPQLDEAKRQQMIARWKMAVRAAQAFRA